MNPKGAMKALVQAYLVERRLARWLHRRQIENKGGMA